MLPSPLPAWLRERIAEVIAAYTYAAALCEDRCKALKAAGARRLDGYLGDERGRLDDYRFDAKYCAGMATRLPLLLDDRLTANERKQILAELLALENGKNQHSLEIPRDPRLLAEWAWQNPWKDAPVLPMPEDGIRQARAEERMTELGLTQREAEAWILIRGYGFESEEAAAIMRTSAANVDSLVRRAKGRMKMRDDLDRMA